MSEIVTAAVWMHSRASLGSLVVLLALASEANDSGVCRPVVEYIARKARVSVRTAQRSFLELKRLGELEVPKAGGGRGNTSDYRILLPLEKGDILSPAKKQVPEKGDIAAVVSTESPSAKGDISGLKGADLAQRVTSAPPTPPVSGDVSGETHKPEVKNEKTNPTAPGVPKGGPSLAPLVDAFRAIGLGTPNFLRGEGKAAQDCLRLASPQDVAAVWQGLENGQIAGGLADWVRDNLSFSVLAGRNRLPVLVRQLGAIRREAAARAEEAADPSLAYDWEAERRRRWQPDAVPEPETGPGQIWKSALVALSMQMSPDDFHAWFDTVSVRATSDDAWEFQVGNHLVVDWLEKRCHKLVEETLRDLVGHPVTVHFEFTPTEEVPA